MERSSTGRTPMPWNTACQRKPELLCAFAIADDIRVPRIIEAYVNHDTITSPLLPIGSDDRWPALAVARLVAPSEFELDLRAWTEVCQGVSLATGAWAFDWMRLGKRPGGSAI